MKNIDLLEHGGGDFRLLIDGYLVDMPDPRKMHYQEVLLALHVGHIHWTPGDIPEWKRAEVFERWRVAWDLPNFNDARRLAYIVDHYRSALTSDLMVTSGADLGTLWRERRWTFLLDLIDHLPGHMHYSAAVANDEEHAKMVADAVTARRNAGEHPEESKGPSLIGWSPEVAAITRNTDAVNALRHAVVAVQIGKKAGDPPKPEKRPVTALEAALRRAENERRQKAHNSLVARVLPHKAAVKS